MSSLCFEKQPVPLRRGGRGRGGVHAAHRGGAVVGAQRLRRRDGDLPGVLELKRPKATFFVVYGMGSLCVMLFDVAVDGAVYPVHARRHHKNRAGAARSSGRELSR
jgi:hypothetical protein